MKISATEFEANFDEPKEENKLGFSDISLSRLDTSGMYFKELSLRGFKVAKGYEDKNINLPVRATAHAAGYDFESAMDMYIPPYPGKDAIERDGVKPCLVPTGVKAYMQPGEVLVLSNRSSGSLKKQLLLANGVGIIDGDYYENETNDGHIMFQFWSLDPEGTIIQKGERLGQGIFLPFLLADGDSATNIRTGGFGSSGN